MLKRGTNTLRRGTAVANPFEAYSNRSELINNLDAIDRRSIRYKFKNTDDPIVFAFESFENYSLDALAKDFVKESITDFISFISKACKQK